jgi:hypothetical protein
MGSVDMMKGLPPLKSVYGFPVEAARSWQNSSPRHAFANSGREKIIRENEQTFSSSSICQSPDCTRFGLFIAPEKCLGKSGYTLYLARQVCIN